MQRGIERQLSKAERQRLVASLVERMRLGTQQELLDALESAGCQVTQATVSRDIRELALEKMRDPMGPLLYLFHNSDRLIYTRETLAALLAQFGRDVIAAQNVVVIRAEIGSAPAIARALDRLGHPLVIGTIAGDDTCLVIAADLTRARELARELGDMIA